jgi:hypothetical protein
VSVRFETRELPYLTLTQAVQGWHLPGHQLGHLCGKILRVDSESRLVELNSKELDELLDCETGLTQD